MEYKDQFHHDAALQSSLGGPLPLMDCQSVSKFQHTTDEQDMEKQGMYNRRVPLASSGA